MGSSKKMQSTVGANMHTRRWQNPRQIGGKIADILHLKFYNFEFLTFAHGPQNSFSSL